MNLNKLASIMAEENSQRETQTETPVTDKVAAAEPTSTDSEEKVVKIAAELYSMGKIIGYGAADQLKKVAAELKVADVDGAATAEGGKGSVAKSKGDSLPTNTGGMPADDAEHKLTEKDLKESPVPVDSKGDSQGAGVGKEASSESVLAKALGLEA